MTGNRQTRMRRAKWAIVLVMLLAIGGIVGVYVAYRRAMEVPVDLIASVPEGTSLSIRNLRHTAIREGITEWKLVAETARFDPTRKKAVLETLSVTFFVSGGDRILLTADHGTLRTDTNDIEISGNIVVRKGPFRLKTERLDYGHKRRVITARTPVELAGQSMTLLADSMTYDLNTRKAQFRGHVNGTIDQHLAL
jgi:LPS export ABC transporter protein LptC